MRVAASYAGAVDRSRATANRLTVAAEASNWATQKIEKQQKVYVKNYNSGPVELEVSVLTRAKLAIDSDQAEGSSSLSLKGKLQTFGLALSNVDSAPVRINAFTIENVLGAPGDLGPKLRNHYEQRLRSNVFNFLSSSKLLGDPKNFVAHMGTGV